MMNTFQIIVDFAAAGWTCAGAIYGLRWLQRRRKEKGGDLTIIQQNDKSNYWIQVKEGVEAAQDQNTGQITIWAGGGKLELARMSVLEARHLAAYIAAVTKYKHCSHYNCLEPEVPGVGYCRYHRGDILTEGVAHPPVFLPEDTNWPVNGEYQHVPEDVQGKQASPEWIEAEDLRERIARHGL